MQELRIAAAGGVSTPALAAAYGVTKSAVYAILRGASRTGAGGPVRAARRTLLKNATEAEQLAMALYRLMGRYEVDEHGCWLWTGALSNGYGSVGVGTRTYKVHTLAYRLFLGDIPKGMVVDHLCHNADLGCKGGRGCHHRRCFNPDHLRATTHKENIRAGRAADFQRSKTHCPHGHPYDAANTLTQVHGGRACRACRKAYHAAYYRRRQDDAAP